jgi:hypothetical protein
LKIIIIKSDNKIFFTTVLTFYYKIEKQNLLKLHHIKADKNCKTRERFSKFLELTNRVKMTNCIFQYDWDELGFQEAGASADVSAGHLIQGKYKMAPLYQV